MAKFKSVVIVKYSKKSVEREIEHTMEKMTKKGYEFVQMSGSPLDSLVLLFRAVEVEEPVNTGPSKAELKEEKKLAKIKAKEAREEAKRLKKENKKIRLEEKKAKEIEIARKKIKKHAEIDEVQQD